MANASTTWDDFSKATHHAVVQLETSGNVHDACKQNCQHIFDTEVCREHTIKFARDELLTISWRKFSINGADMYFSTTRYAPEIVTFLFQRIVDIALNVVRRDAASHVFTNVSVRSVVSTNISHINDK